MVDLHNLALEMEKEILNNNSNMIIESPLLTKNQAEKLTNDYLRFYNPRMGAINPDLPSISSYVVFAGGRKNA